VIWDEPDSLSGMAGKLGPLMSGAPTLCKFNGKTGAVVRVIPSPRYTYSYLFSSERARKANLVQEEKYIQGIIGRG